MVASEHGCLEEFRLVVSDPGIKTWLASMDLDASDVDMLFHIIDDDYDGHLTVDELVRGASERVNACSNQS
eukprot:764457-Amphidinium_carterae.1